MANLSGTITAGGTSQQIAAFDPRRHYFSVQNLSSEDLWVDFGTAAVADQPSYKVESGQIGQWELSARELICRSISIIGATTGSKFTAKDSIV